MKWGVHKADLVVFYDFKQLLFSILQIPQILLLIEILKSNLNSTVIFEKFYLVAFALWVFLYLLKKVLTM